MSSSPPDVFDVAVIGDSITGHLTALALAELARGVECDTTLIDPFRGNPNVVLAGLAHGIPSDDYPAMVVDAARVVEEVCR